MGKWWKENHDRSEGTQGDKKVGIWHKLGMRCSFVQLTYPAISFHTIGIILEKNMMLVELSIDIAAVYYNLSKMLSEVSPLTSRTQPY